MQEVKGSNPFESTRIYSPKGLEINLYNFFFQALSIFDMSIIRSLANWNKEKINIFQKKKKCFPKERQIWVCKLGINIGREQNGNLKEFVRPVLILNHFGENFFVLPLTSQLKNNRFRFLLTGNNIGLSKESELMLDQIRTISQKRMIWQIGWCSKDSFGQIKNRMSELILLGPKANK